MYAQYEAASVLRARSLSILIDRKVEQQACHFLYVMPTWRVWDEYRLFLQLLYEYVAKKVLYEIFREVTTRVCLD